jgi:uncharacterized membrane protein YkgB
MWLTTVDRRIVRVMARLSVPALRLALGVVFVWFGALKLVGASPAADLVAATVGVAVNPDWFLPFLGLWEVAIGVCLADPLRLAGRSAILTRVGIALLALQMPGTFMPLLVLPERCFDGFAPTLEGQYIIKNLVLIAGALVLGGAALGRDARRGAASRADDASGARV